jgi:hypothetical protein
MLDFIDAYIGYKKHAYIIATVVIKWGRGYKLKALKNIFIPERTYAIN